MRKNKSPLCRPCNGVLGLRGWSWLESREERHPELAVALRDVAT